MTTERERPIEALAASDEVPLKDRADRLEWLSLHGVNIPSIFGRAETLHVLEEARQVFVNGHFVATLLLAMCFIEHAITEELQIDDPTIGRLNFSKAIQRAKDKQLFPVNWLDRADTLRLRRNPFAHYKEIDHRHSLGMRVHHEKKHPTTILETDAKDAIELMYNFFTATLREIPTSLP